MKKIILLGLASTLFTACQTVPYQGTARDVTLKPRKGGVIAIPTDPRDEDRVKAEGMIARNCKPYRGEIVEEGEIVVGTKVDSAGKETDREDSRAQVGSIFGIPISSGEASGKNTKSSSTTTSIKEWQISYRCVQGSKG